MMVVSHPCAASMASPDWPWHSNAPRTWEESCWSDLQSGASPSSVACAFLSPAPTPPTPPPATRTCSRPRCAPWSSASSCRASGSATWPRAPSSSTPRTTTWCARACSRAGLTRRPRDWTCSAPAAPVLRRRSTSATRSHSDRSRPGIAGGVDSISDAPIVYPRSYQQLLLRSYRGRGAWQRLAPWLRPAAEGLQAGRAGGGRAAHRACRWGRAPRSWPSAGRSAAPSRTCSPTTAT